MGHPQLKGPSIREGFTVYAGHVVVQGRGGSVLLAPGASWPGTSRLSADLLASWQPERSVQTPDAQVAYAALTEREQEMARGFIRSQLVRCGPVPTRLSRVPGVLGINRDTLAAIVGSGRDVVCKSLPRLQGAGRG